MKEIQPLLSNTQTQPITPIKNKKTKSILLGLLLIIGLISLVIALRNNINSSNINSKFTSKSSKISPNIVFVVVDDLGWADISFNGAEYDTPYIDHIIKTQSIYLDKHYVGLLCSPSRSQFLTGRYAFNMGIGKLEPFLTEQIATAPLGAPFMSDLLKKYGGYSTYALGKWQLGYASEESLPLQRGFDYFYGFNGGEINYYNKTIWHCLDWWENEEPDWDAQGDFSTIQISDKLTQIINKHDVSEPESPFYIYAALQSVHSPLEASPTEEFVSECASEVSILDDERQLYCQHVKEIDLLMYKLTKSLKRAKNTNLWDNTIIVFTTDNGGTATISGCNYPFRGYKGTYFEGALRVLTFLTGGYFEDTVYGSDRTSVFHGSDWTPTLLSLANVNIPKKDNIIFDGYDLSNMILYGDEHNTRTEVPLNVGTLYEHNNAIIFYNDDILYKYILLNEDEVEKGIKSWCIFDENNQIETYQPVNTDGTLFTEFLFNLDNDKNESYNFVEYYDDFDITTQEKVTKLIEIAQLKLSKYRENEYWHDRLDCFGTKFETEADPYNFGGVWQTFFSRKEYDAYFNDYCGDEIADNKALRELHLTQW